MPELLHDPPLPRKPAADEPFLQRVTLVRGGVTLGRATWLDPARDGVVQIVELTVSAAHRRKGHGTALLNETVAQAGAICRLRGRQLRRIWVAVEQKSQVIARAFLTQRGFHHVATLEEILQKQDLLIYLRSFD